MTDPLGQPKTRRALIGVISLLLVATSLASPAVGHPEHDGGTPGKQSRGPLTAAERFFLAANGVPLPPTHAELKPAGKALCVAGFAGGYPCRGVDLASFVPLTKLGGGAGNDIWGWSDPATDRDYVIIGRTSGVTFVDITIPTMPDVVGTLGSHGASSIWRDLKVYDSHAFIVSEAFGSGLQIFDLRQLAAQKERPHTFTETAWHGSFSAAHNIAINEDTGYAYVVGSDICSGGLHMIDISRPASPEAAGCFATDGYTHDVQCVLYAGPDPEYQGREICLASNEDTLTIVDVTNKASPQQVSRSAYAASGYTHQGWLTADHRFFLADDELDELTMGTRTRTLIWDVSDLQRPVLDFVNQGTTTAIDHNQYVRGDRTYQANYTAGLRILTTDSLALGSTEEVAFFDSHPETNAPKFDGAWSAYPFYRANVVALATIDRGLFVLGYAGESGSVHVADIETRSVLKSAARWRAIGKVRVHDATGTPVAGARVTMRWSNGKVKTCVTGLKGRCATAVGRPTRRAKVSFRIVAIASGDDGYASWLNEDRDGDSNGFRDTVRRPPT